MMRGPVAKLFLYSTLLCFTSLLSPGEQDMVFSKKPFALGQPAPAPLEKFELGDPIYATATLMEREGSGSYKPTGRTGSLKELLQASGNATIRIRISIYNKKEFLTDSGWVQLSAASPLATSKTLPFEIAVDPAHAPQLGSVALALGLAHEYESNHKGKTLNLTVFIHAGEESGDTILVAMGQTRLAYKEGAEQIYTEWNKALETNKAKSRNLPAPGMTNPTLEKDIARAVSGSSDPEDQPLRVVIVDKEWTPVRHEISGALVGRVLRAAAATKKEDGSCYVSFVHVRQAYINGKFNNSVELDGVGEGYYIDCAKASK